MRFYPFLLIGIFILAWGVSLGAPYQYDDFVTPLQDPASQSLTSWINYLGITLRPLSKLTYALESSAGLTEAFERRILNFILAISCMLLLNKFLQNVTRDAKLSGILALTWAIHPVQAETFISLAGRPSLLAMLFILLSILSDKDWQKILFAGFAILSKEIAVFFFAFQILWMIKEKKNYWLFAFFVIPLILLNKKLIWHITYSWNEGIHIVNWWDGFAGISAGFWYYLFPWKIGVDPEFPLTSSAVWFFVSIILFTFLSFIVFKTKDQEKKWSLLFWMALILPTQSIIPKLDPISLRTLSIASLALPMLIAVYYRHYLNGSKSFIIIPFTILCTYSTIMFAKAYETHVTLWRDASEKTSIKVRPLVNQAYFLVREGKYDEALSALKEAQKRAPRNLEVHERMKSLELLIKEKAI